MALHPSGLKAATHRPTQKTDILAAFPEPISKMPGAPNTREFIRVLKHVMTCAQLYKSDISPLNVLCVCLPPNLYENQTVDAYPYNPENPGAIPIYGMNDTPSMHANTKAVCEYHKSMY